MPDEEKKVALRLPQDVYNAVAARAALHMRSVNNELVVLLKLGLVYVDPESDALIRADELIEKYTPEKDEA